MHVCVRERCVLVYKNEGVNVVHHNVTRSAVDDDECCAEFNGLQKGARGHCCMPRKEHKMCMCFREGAGHEYMCSVGVGICHGNTRNSGDQQHHPSIVGCRVCVTELLWYV